MVEPVEIYVPCDVFDVKVRVGPEDASSPLEVLFLRAIYEDVGSFDVLADLFGIGPRLALDLVFDLWRRGYVVIDLARGRLHLTEITARAAAAGELEQLAVAQATEETWEVMQERLAGYVLPAWGPRSPKQARAAVPGEAFDVGIHDIGRDDLYGALRRVAEREMEHVRRIRVLGAHIGALEGLTALSRRWLLVRVLAAVDPDDGRVSVEILPDGSLPLGVRARMAQRLGRLAADQPNSDFVRYLVKGAQTRAVRPLQVEEELSSMADKIDELGSVSPALRAEHHEDLLAVNDQLAAWCNDHLSTGLKTEVLAGLDDHIVSIRKLVHGARRQLVIACPWIRSKPLNAILPHLHAALARGVQLYLLWGIDKEAVLDHDVRNALGQLRAEFPLTCFVSERSTRTHAKLLIQDDRAGVITSCNFLSSTRRATCEIGLLLTAGRSARCPPIEQLLSWARSEYPEYIRAQAMYSLGDDFRTPTDVDDPNGALSAPPFDEILGRPADEGLGASAGRAWQLAWRDQYASVSRRVSRTQQESGRVLRDGEHRAALWSALRDTKCRLLVASDQLGRDVVDEHVLRALADLVARGVHIRIIHCRASPHFSVAAGDPVNDLQTLSESAGERFAYVSDADTHAKVVVSDNNAIVSSFNFLSFEGFYEAQTGGSRRSRSELGMEVVGKADAVVEALSGYFPHFMEGFPAAVPDEPGMFAATAPALAGVLVSEQQAVAAALAGVADSASTATVLSDRLSNSATPWALLERLAEIELPLEVMRIAVASCLVNAHEKDTEAEKKWLLWLAEDAWRRGSYIESATLRLAAPHLPSQVVPSAELALVVSARDTDAFGEVAEEACLTELSGSERLALAILSVAELALRGNPSAKDVADAERAALTPAWLACFEAVESYWSATYESLPMSEIARDLDKSRHDADLDERWETLGQALRDGAARNFGFASGKKTGSFLYRPTGELGQLAELLARREARDIGPWLQQHEPGDLSEWLDDMTRAASGRDDQLFHSGIRMSYVAILDRIFSAAHAVADMASTADDAHNAHRGGRAGEFAEALRQLWPRLQQEAEALENGSADAVRKVLDDLEPLRRWSPR